MQTNFVTQVTGATKCDWWIDCFATTNGQWDHGATPVRRSTSTYDSVCNRSTTWSDDTRLFTYNVCIEALLISSAKFVH